MKFPFRVNILKNWLGLPKPVYALFFVRFIIAFGSFVSTYITFFLTSKLGWSEKTAGIFVSFMAFFSFLGLMIAGKAGDTIGRKKTMIGLLSIIFMTMTSCALIGFHPVIPFIIALTYWCTAGFWPVFGATVADITTIERRKDAYSFIYWGNNIGFSMGAAAAGFMFKKMPLMLFIIAAAATALSIFIILNFLPESKPQKKHLDEKLSKGKKINTLAALIQTPTLFWFSGITILSSFVYSQSMFAFPLYLKNIFGDNQGAVNFGMLLMSNGICVVLLTSFIIMLSRHQHPLASIGTGHILFTIGFGAYAFVSGMPALFIFTIIWTLGEILGATNTETFVSERALPTHRSRINSVQSFCRLIGDTLSPVVAGFIINYYGFKSIWYPVGAISALAAIATFLLLLFETRKVFAPNKAKSEKADA